MSTMSNPHLFYASSLGEANARAERLRVALVHLVGTDGERNLEQMQLAVRLLPTPKEGKAALLDAIEALVFTLP